jgi:hypothetical protein
VGDRVGQLAQTAGHLGAGGRLLAQQLDQRLSRLGHVDHAVPDADDPGLPQRPQVGEQLLGRPQHRLGDLLDRGPRQSQDPEVQPLDVRGVAERLERGGEDPAPHDVAC